MKCLILMTLLFFLAGCGPMTPQQKARFMRNFQAGMNRAAQSIQQQPQNNYLQNQYQAVQPLQAPVFCDSYVIGNQIHTSCY